MVKLFCGKLVYQKIVKYASLLPITIKGISLNLFYIFFYFNSKKFFNHMAFAYILYITISYILGVVYFFDKNIIIFQTASYLVYLSMIGLLFLKYEFSIDTLINSVLILSFIYSLWVLFSFFYHPNISLQEPFLIKSKLREYIPDWPQRYSILVVFSFIYSIELFRNDKRYFIVPAVLGVAIFLTFTRAIYVSTFIGLLIYYVMHIVKSKNKIDAIFIFLFSIASIFVLIVSNKAVLYSFIEVLNRTIVSISDFITTGRVLDSSDMKRLCIYKFALDLLKETNFITGTGFAGIYLFSNDYGSLHNQYLDILFKTGIFGLLIYVYLWLYLLYFYLKHNYVIFSALFSIFVFGFFHETTRLTYVGVLFFILLSFALNKENNKEVPNE